VGKEEWAVQDRERSAEPARKEEKTKKEKKNRAKQSEE